MQKLIDFASNVYSQNGEDGIVEKIFSIIGPNSKVCVEFGAWDGFHLSNSANLWSKKGWQGVLIELNADRFKELVENTKQFDCRCINARVEGAGHCTLENILKRELIAGPVDLLSIDIDGDDYYILQSLDGLKPRVIICEYNPTIPPMMDLVAEPGNYFGCSAFSLVKLAEEKGYKLVAVTTCNCIFVRQEEFFRFSQFETALPNIALTGHLTWVISGYAGDYLLSREPIYGCTVRSQQKFHRGQAYYVPEPKRPRTVKRIRKYVRGLLGQKDKA